jgi:formate hydrogenlyase transcriptional activator
MERSVILSDGRVLTTPLAELRRGQEGLDSDGTLESLERQYIIRVLRDTSGVIAGPRGAPVRLGMKRTTLQSRILKMGDLSPGIRMMVPAGDDDLSAPCGSTGSTITAPS